MSINFDIGELKPRITIFGVGGAGCNAVNNMIDGRGDFRRQPRRCRSGRDGSHWRHSEGPTSGRRIIRRFSTQQHFAQ
jgi:hypothetical protein